VYGSRSRRRHRLELRHVALCVYMQASIVDLSPAFNSLRNSRSLLRVRARRLPLSPRRVVRKNTGSRTRHRTFARPGLSTRAGIKNVASA
jgi:hypothetical protein